MMHELSLFTTTQPTIQQQIACNGDSMCIYGPPLPRPHAYNLPPHPYGPYSPTPDPQFAK
jgi:hypothetical protein